MKTLNYKVSVLAFVLMLSSAATAQQGALDPAFNNQGGSIFGVYQDPQPSTPDPLPPDYVGDFNTWYNRGDAYADGGFMVVGTISEYQGDPRHRLWVRKFLPDGTPDINFAGGAVRGEFYRWTTGVNGTANIDYVVGKIQPLDGKIVVAAQCNRINPYSGPGAVNLDSDLCLLRFNQNGTLDTTFGGNTVVAISGDGSVSTNYTFDPGKVFTITGTNTYNSAVKGMNGYPTDIEIGADGRIYVFGNSSDSFLQSGGTPAGPGIKPTGFVAVYTPSGTLQTLNKFWDQTSNGRDNYGNVEFYDGEVLSNGGFVVAGRMNVRQPPNDNLSLFKWAVWKDNTANGIFLDGGAGGGPANREGAFSIKLLRSNKIIVGGTYGNGYGTLARYNSDLTLDTTFGISGLQIYDGSFRPPNNVLMGGDYRFNLAAIQTDGKIIAYGPGSTLWRFTPNGLPDHSFGGFQDPGNENGYGYVPATFYLTPFPVRNGASRNINFGYPFLKPNGRILTAGSVGSDLSAYQLSLRGAVTQLTSYPNKGGIFADFDNDGRTDISVFRPSDGVWHYLRSFNNSYSPFQWGLASDKIAPADYDGDGRTDRAVFRNGTWYIFQSSDNQIRYVQWGTAGDLPRPGDFNGDGFADFAVFRPSNGTWYILYSNLIQTGNITYSIVQFGASGDIPLIADFDGDGRSDISVFRNGVWYFVRSSNQSIGIVQFGLAGDVPTIGDYDADGKADLAVFRNGAWYAQKSSDGSYIILNWGTNGDKPVPGDYDNDGRNDFAIYRDSVWWILRTSDGGYSATSFGLASDVPIQSAYLSAN